MAVTSMWPIKGRVDKVINYARNPEKTIESVHEDLAGLHTIDGVVEYAADDMKTERRMYVTGINCSEENAAQQFMETKRLWSKITGIDKTLGRVCYHGYQSFKEGEVDAETAHEIGVKLAERLWGNEYEVIVATHCNTNHYHNHLILNPVSLIDGHKFFNSPADYQAMRRESDRLCLEYRLSVIEDPKGRGQNYEEYSAERNGRPTNRSLIRDDIDRAVKASMTEREFFRILEEMGYTLKLYGENGRPLKYPALRPTGAKGFFRFHKLAESGYSMEDIQQRIAVNYHRKNPFPDAEQEKANEYRTQTRPKTKATGLHALYIRYCYELHIITRYPTSVKRVSFFMREDLKRLEKLDEQTRFLADNGIETIEDLHSFRADEEAGLKPLTARRSSLRNELKRVIRAADTEGITRVKGQIAEVSEEMKKIRKQVRLCDSIEERSRPMEEALLKLTEEQTREEEKPNEQLFRGRGGAGRPYEPGRR